MKRRRHALLLLLQLVVGSHWIPTAAQTSNGPDGAQEGLPAPAAAPPTDASTAKEVHAHAPHPAPSAVEAEQQRAMRLNAAVQRAWLSSAVVPGLGQAYNKQYWKIPCFYLGFLVAGYKIYEEHEEMQSHKRNKLTHCSSGCTALERENLPGMAFTQKRIYACRRTRDLFVCIAAAWYLLNVLDAYAGAHNASVDFEDDIGAPSLVVAPPMGGRSAASAELQLSIPIPCP